MPAFIPKFVDLVRVTTSTQGTGPIVAGPATQGFSNFAESLAVGDQFYYCVQGVDKPAEREVGRGVLLANGTIGRQAINGTLTNFTLGTKTLSLVAGAEWFRQQQQASETLAALESSQIASRSALAALTTAVPGSTRFLTELGREGSFCFETGNFAARVAADPERAIFIPSATDPTGSSGAWVRKFTGPCNAQWWGFFPGIGDVASKLVAAIATVRVLAANMYLAGYGEGSPELLIPAAKREYGMGSTTIDLLHAIRLRGEGTSIGGGSVLRWSAPVTGLRIQNRASGGASASIAQETSAAGAHIEGLALLGAFNGTEGEQHGIHLRAMCTIRDCYISNFPGNGIHAVATIGDSTTEGNVNLFRLDRVWVESCRNGLYTQGADSNAGAAYSFSAVGCRQWGIWDRSFLGNSFYDPHIATCATTASNTGQTGKPASFVHQNGRRYFAVRGRESWCSTNPPTGSTADNNGWGYWMDGGVTDGVPTWTTGMAIRSGGGVLVEGLNNSSTLTNPYVELDCAFSQLDQRALVLGAGNFFAVRVITDLPWDRLPNIITANGSLTLRGGVAIEGSFSCRNGYNLIGPQSGPPSDHTLTMDNTNYYNIQEFRSFREGVPQNDGRVMSARDFGMVYAARANHSFRDLASNKTIFSADLQNGVRIASGAFGYDLGTGGIATQSSSKSASIVLNRACGQIILNAASLAAGATVSFSLSNSLIASTDLVQVVIASGGGSDSYDIQVTAIANGSCRVKLRNSGQVELGEALTLNYAILKAANA